MNGPANIDRAALCSLEIEQGLFGAILSANSVFDVVETLVTADDFAEPLHARLFDDIAKTRAVGGLITLPLVLAAMGGDKSAVVADGVTAGQYVARLAA